MTEGELVGWHHQLNEHKFEGTLGDSEGQGSLACCRSIRFSSVQLLSRIRLFATLWTAARQASLSITKSWSLFKLMFIESVMPSNRLILGLPSDSFRV